MVDAWATKKGRQDGRLCGLDKQHPQSLFREAPPPPLPHSNPPNKVAREKLENLFPDSFEFYLTVREASCAGR